MNALKRPTEALNRISRGCAPDDWRLAASYISMLEKSFESRFALREDSPIGTAVIVGHYGLVVRDSVEQEARPFELTIFRNRVCSWHDQQARIGLHAPDDLETLAGNLVQDTSPGVTMEVLSKIERSVAAARENYRGHEFTIDTPISEKAFGLIVEKEAIMSYNWHVPKDITDAIDYELAKTFWSRVNPYLEPSVPRHAVSGTFLHDKCGDGHDVSGEPYRA